MSAVNITKETFESVVLNSDKAVLVDFWASWCGPCRMVLPLLEEIAQERADILVAKINVDEEPELAEQYEVTTIPTLMVFRGGEVVVRKSGALSKAQLLAMSEK